jgi:MFS family permease
MPARRDVDRAKLLALGRSLLISAFAPWLVYVLVRPHVGSATEALAIGGAIPAAWALLRLAFTRKVEWLAVISAAVFAVTLVVSLLSGGSALPLKLRYTVTTGAMGLACVISIMIRRPLPLALARLPGLHDPDRAALIEQRFRAPRRRRRLTVVTGLFGVTLLIDAAVRAILAFTLPTTTFLAASPVASWVIVGAGVALLVLYLRHTRIRGQADPDAAEVPAEPGPVGTGGVNRRRW